MRYAPLGSHKSNPVSVPRGIMDSYSILPWVTWEVITSVVGYPDGGYYNTRWLTGLWSTTARVENIELKDAWHWGRDSNVITISLGNQSAPFICRPYICGGLCGR